MSDKNAKTAKKKKKIVPGLAPMLVLAVLVLSILLTAASYLTCFIWYTGRLAGDASELGDHLAHSLAEGLTPALVSSGQGLREEMDDIRDRSGAARVFICRPNERGDCTVLTCSPEGSGDAAVDISEFVLVDLLDGKEVAPESSGKLLTALAPVPRSEGEPVYYAAVEFDMSGARGRAVGFSFLAALITAVAAAGLTALYFLLVRRVVLRPINALTEAAVSYTEGGNREAFNKLRISSGKEFEGLVESFRMLLVELELNNMEQQEQALLDQKSAGDMALAGSLSAAARPSALPENQNLPFQISGLVYETDKGLTGCFYDYFLQEDGTLCFTIGEASGHGLSQAIFAVIGETTLKSHLRSGLSLDEAMSAANQQLFEMTGGSMYLNVVAGIMDGVSGTVRIINAGQSVPLFMRFRDERYEWSEAFSYVALGLNENVEYTSMSLELVQGDRLFFHTDGIGNIKDANHISFRDEELRKCLNELKVRNSDTAGQLELMRDAAAYAEYAASIEPYAIMSLEFCRKDRLSAHCLISPDAKGAQALTDFIREQLRANRIEERQIAVTLVVADELFSLCRAKNAGESRFMAECAVSSDGLAVLRIRGDMGGVDPVEAVGPLSGTADFLRRNCQRVSFEPSPSSDAVTAVRRVKEKGYSSYRRNSRT